MTTSRFAIAAVCLSVAAAAVAQEMQPVTTVASFHVKPGSASDFMAVVEEMDVPVFDELMASGAVLAWGLSTPVVHLPGQASHSIWWTSSSIAQMDQVIAAFEAAEKRIAEESPELFEKMLGSVDFDRHGDEVLRDVVINVGDGQGPAPDDRPYTWVFTVKTKTGMEDEYLEAWKANFKPLMDDLVVKNLVNAYGVSVQAVQTNPDVSYSIWVSFSDFATYEKARLIYIAARSELPEDVFEKTQAMLEPDGGRTYVYREEIFKTAGM